MEIGAHARRIWGPRDASQTFLWKRWRNPCGTLTMRRLLLEGREGACLFFDIGLTLTQTGMPHVTFYIHFVADRSVLEHRNPRHHMPDCIPQVCRPIPSENDCCDGCCDKTMSADFDICHTWIVRRSSLHAASPADAGIPSDMQCGTMLINRLFRGLKFPGFCTCDYHISPYLYLALICRQGPLARVRKQVPRRPAASVTSAAGGSAKAMCCRTIVALSLSQVVDSPPNPRSSPVKAVMLFAAPTSGVRQSNV